MRSIIIPMLVRNVTYSITNNLVRYYSTPTLHDNFKCSKKKNSYHQQNKPKSRAINQNIKSSYEYMYRCLPIKTKDFDYSNEK